MDMYMDMNFSWIIYIIHIGYCDIVILWCCDSDNFLEPLQVLMELLTFIQYLHTGLQLVLRN